MEGAPRRAERTVDVNETIASIRAVAAQAGLSGDEATWYLFGSLLRAPDAARDVDLLVVTDSSDRGVQLRGWLYDQPTPEPLHLTTMTSREEEALDFIRNERAVEIFPANALAAATPPPAS